MDEAGLFDILVLNDGILGYNVTLQPELSNAQYVVNLTPVPAIPWRNQSQSLARHETYIREYGRPTQIRRRNEQSLRRRYPPIIETLLQAVAEADRAERSVQAASCSAQTTSDLPIFRQGEPRTGQSTRRLRNQAGSRQRRRRRHRARRSPDNFRLRRPTESDEPMYEVLDVDYEKITDIGKVEPPKDWKIIPKYELSPKEIAQQERDLYYSMTNDSRPEETSKAREGDPTCCVCTDNIATRVVIPCGHRCLCRQCALSIATSRSIFGGKRLPKLCPICQAAIAIMPRLC